MLFNIVCLHTSSFGMLLLFWKSAHVWFLCVLLAWSWIKECEVGARVRGPLYHHTASRQVQLVFQSLNYGAHSSSQCSKIIKSAFFLSHFKSFKHFFRTNSTRGIERVLRKFFKNMLIFAIGVIVHCTIFVTFKHCALQYCLGRLLFQLYLRF